MQVARHKTVPIMKDLLKAIVAEDGKVTITSDYVFPQEHLRKGRFHRQETLYANLIEALKKSSEDCTYVIRMLESARKDARFDYLGLHPELEEVLLDWRRDKAASLHVPAYYVIHQSVLLSIADMAPHTTEELLMIPGFGPVMNARYGEEILDLICATEAGGENGLS